MLPARLRPLRVWQRTVTHAGTSQGHVESLRCGLVRTVYFSGAEHNFAVPHPADCPAGLQADHACLRRPEVIESSSLA